jgi:galactose mutarotase-like enzyme
MSFQVSTSWTLHGLRAVVLENRWLHLVVLPEAGGKVYQIRYKPHDADLLWNHPHIRPARHTIHSRYDDVWSGGMDELFPVDEAGVIEGESYPDHGELWTGVWDAETFADDQQAGVRLRFVTPVSSFAVEKTILLRPDSARVEIHYQLTNLTQAEMPFLWKLHPAFAVTAKHRIDFPQMTVIREPGFPGSLGDAPLTFPWPGTGKLDLRQVPAIESRATHFFYGTGLKEGWCAVTNTATGLATAVSFDLDVFPSCWLFASHGGWRNLNVAVLEPCTGYPLNITAAMEAGRVRRLGAGQTLKTRVLLTMQEGLQSVGGIDAAGKLLPGN